ncbi:MAG: hypothetical protein ABIG71_02785 [Candidatus Uhrbacteria bacterium]
MHIGQRRTEMPKERPPEQVRREWEHDVDKLERRFLFEKAMSSQELEQHLDSLRQEAVRHGFDARFLDVFQATALHEVATNLHLGFFTELEKTHGDPTLENVSQAQYAEAFAQYDADSEDIKHGQQKLSTLEEDAQQLYTSAKSQLDWSTRSIRRGDAETLSGDLKYLQAIRIQDPADRTKVLEVIEKRLMGHILNEEDFGIRSEHQITLLIRRWAREKGVEHRVVITHSLPRDDYAHGEDLVLMIGSRRFRLNQKTLKLRDSSREEYNDKIIAEGRAKSQTSGSCFVALDSDVLRMVWQLTTQKSLDATEGRRLNKAKRNLLDQLDGALTTGADVISIREIIDPKRRCVTGTERKRPLTRKQLMPHVNARVLLGFEVLNEQDVNDVGKYLKVQNRFLDVAADIITSVEELNSPSQELVQKIKQVMGS